MIALDLDRVAEEIEARRPRWVAAGFDVGPLTWRDIGQPWPYPLVARSAAVAPDSVGVIALRSDAEIHVVLFGGNSFQVESWADVDVWDKRQDSISTTCPQFNDLAAFSRLLDELFEPFLDRAASA